MGRNDYVYVNLDKELIERVQDLLQLFKKKGFAKYTSNKHFVTLAVEELLAKERHIVKANNVEVPA